MAFPTVFISTVFDADYHQKKHFITKSNLDAQSIIDQVSKEVSLSLPKRKLTCLIIESGWVKKVEKALALDGRIVVKYLKYPTHRLPCLSS